MTRIVEITWADAWVSSGDMSVKKAQSCEPIITHTIGYLIAENQHGVTVSADIYEKDKKNVKIVNFIPWGMVEEYVEYITVESDDG